MAAPGGTTGVESAEIIRLMLQFCKENGLYRSLQTLQEESRVSLNAVDSLEGLLGDISHGRWDAVLQAVSYLSLPDTVMQDLYSQVVLELLELGEAETATHLLKETAPLRAMRQDQPERYLRLEHLLKRPQFDAREAYENQPREKRRDAIAQAVSKNVTVAPPSRLLTLVGQAIKWQQHAGILPASAKVSVFHGVAAAAVEEKEECPVVVSKTIRFGDKSHPETVAFSLDGHYCVSGSIDGFVEVWDYHSAVLRKDLEYQETGCFMMHDKAVIAAAFSKDSELLATGSEDGQLKVWRVATGECARRFERAHNQGITSIAWSKDSSLLLTASFDQTARAHGIKSGKSLKEYRGHTSYVNSAIYTRDNSRVITGSSDGQVIVFDAKTTDIAQQFSPPAPLHANSTLTFTVNCVVLAPRQQASDEPLIYVCSRTNTVLLMNLAGQVIKSYSSGKRTNGDFVAMTPSPKGEYLYACAEDNQLYCFNTASGDLVQTVKVTEKEVVGVCHHPSRNILAVYSSDGKLAFLKP